MTETPERSSSFGSLLAGMLVGAVAGIAVAVLYAPKPGRETREELAQRLEDLKGRIDQMTHDVAEMAKTARADLSEAVETGRAAAKAKAEELRRQVGMH